MSTKIAVLGQSNSILGAGFFNKFLERHQPIEVVAAGRVGASPSIIGPYFARHSFFRGAEYCIVDMCAIDFSLVSGGTIGLYDVIRWLEWIGHSAKKAGCEPIFVCIPVSNIDAAKLLISTCISLFERNEWFYLDVRTCIRTLLQGSDRRAEDLYRDPSHPGVELAEFTADALAKLIEQIKETEMTVVDRVYPLIKFDVINLQERIKDHLVSYETSLIRFNGVRLERGKSYTIETGDITAVSGMMVNSAACKGVLSIHGDRAFHKNLRLRPYHPTQFEARLVPICKPLRDDNGRLTLSTAAGPVGESDVTFHSTQSLDDDLGYVEIADMIVERGYDLFTYSATRVVR
jgi:hypothetical protein